MTAEHIPGSVVSRFIVAWAEALEGMVAHHAEWCRVARFRCRLLLSAIPKDVDRINEIKKRLNLWEKGEIDTLAQRVLGQHIQINEDQQKRTLNSTAEDRVGPAACHKARKNALRKAVMGFVGKPAYGPPEELSTWTNVLVPASSGPDAPHPNRQELHIAQLQGWGRGQFQAAKTAMLESSDCLEGHKPTLPRVSLPNLTAPGPSGERPEHLSDCLSANCAGPKRRLRRALDAFTVQWATGTVCNDARWLLNTSMFWLKKDAGVDLKDEDEAWLVDCKVKDIEAEMEVEEACNESSDVPDNPMGLETGAKKGKPGVRPIQMGEFLRKHVTRRMLAVDKRRIQCSMTNARQWGVGVSGGTEAIIHTHYAIEELYFKGKLARPLAVIQVDQNNMFGSLEWSSIRDAMLDEVPNFAASTSWKHSSRSYIRAGSPSRPSQESGSRAGGCNCSLRSRRDSSRHSKTSEDAGTLAAAAGYTRMVYKLPRGSGNPGV